MATMRGQPSSSAQPQSVGEEQGAWRVAVVIPARNEAAGIGAALRSVFECLRHSDDRIEATCVVVVADACTDATARIARGYAADNPSSVRVIETSTGNVGAARALGVDVARSLLGTDASSRTWIANTDADTVVPRDWISSQLRHADRGFIAVAGIVDVDDFSDHGPIVQERFRTTYTDRLPTDGSGHPHVHGANIGIRLDAYDSIGGWAPESLSEDHQLWNRLLHRGWPTVSPVDVIVTTSGRAVSRCPGGFADALRSHAS